MPNKDPSRRCFHCVFTNCRGTGGALGSISSELLASLFSTPLRRWKKHLPPQQHQHNRRHRAKRARIDEGQSSGRTFTTGSSSNNEPSPPPPPTYSVNEREDEDDDGDKLSGDEKDSGKDD
jgi:hypothetical protein